MLIEYVVLAALLLITVGGFIAYRINKNKPVVLPAPAVVEAAAIVDVKPPDPVPVLIAIGEHPDRPVITIEASDAHNAYHCGRRLDISSGPISRLSSLLQAVPAVLVAGEASGKQLMEVVVNGDLVRAADGNGYRAFTMGAKGIKENARVFEVQNLQNMINAAALWQVASVVVAQKHLADISRKLDEIKDGVKHLSRFLDNQRKSRIEAAYTYLGQAYKAIKAGELPGSVRNQLEDCERELLEIQIHLEKEFRQRLEKPVEHTETIGTEELKKDIARKIANHDDLAQDLAFCVRTRIVAWHVLSLYPGEPQLKQVRRDNIQQGIDLFQTLGPALNSAIEKEISKVDSKFNFASTLEERRKQLRQELNTTVQKLAVAQKAGNHEVKNSARLMVEHDAPSRLLFQFEAGVLVGACEVM